MTIPSTELNNIISVRDFHKDLGVLLQSNLSWTKQYTALYARKHIKLLVYSGALSPLLTLSPLEDKFMFLLLDHKCPTVVYFGALHLSKISKCAAQKHEICHRPWVRRAVNYKEHLNHLKLLPLMHHFELADSMFLV